VPEVQSVLALVVAVAAPPLALGVPVVLLSEPQPDIASVPTRATPVTPASRRLDWIFTFFEPLQSRENASGAGARWGQRYGGWVTQ